MTEPIILGVLTFLFVGLYRWLALRYRWLDHPNQRSSHSVVTPRGAGIVFALFIVGAAIGLLHQHWAPLLSLMVGSAIALTGWWDDIRGTSSLTRLILYIAFAGVTVALLFVAPFDSSTNVTGSVVLWGAIATLGLTWLINLYNFMDGINGIATLEAIFVLAGIYWFADGTLYGQIFSQLHLCGGTVLVGFLLWNFPAGKIFMGDAGSAFLGFFLGVLILWSVKLDGPAPSIWFILLAIFIVDTGYTLLARMTTAQNFLAAHRLHAYQRLTVLLRGSHVRTTSVLMMINVGWLLPLAWLVHTQQLSQACGLILSFLPLLTACHWLRAGIPRRGEL